MRPAGPGRLAPGAKGQAGLVHLDQAGQGLALGVDHRPAQLARPAARPTCSCPARAAATAAGPRCRSGASPPARRPGTRCAAAGGCRAAPCPAVTEACALAGRALQGQPLAPQLPALVVPAGRAAEPVGPALLEQPAGAGRVVGEPAPRTPAAIAAARPSRPPPCALDATYSATGARGMSHNMIKTKARPLPARSSLFHAKSCRRGGLPAREPHKTSHRRAVRARGERGCGGCAGCCVTPARWSMTGRSEEVAGVVPRSPTGPAHDRAAPRPCAPSQNRGGSGAPRARRC